MHLLRSILFALTLVMACALYTPIVHAEMVCPDGMGECPAGDCAPMNGSCCSGGGYCNAGQQCTRNGGCAPEGTVDCGDGTYAPAGATCCSGGGSCDAGNVCAGNGKCIPIGHILCGDHSCPLGTMCTLSGCIPLGSVDCGGGKYCESGSICGTDECIDSSSPRVCSNGSSYCEAGNICKSDGNCENAQTKIPAPPAPPEIDWNQFIPPPNPPPSNEESITDQPPLTEDPPVTAEEPPPEKKEEPPPPPVVELNVKGMTIPNGEGTGSLSCSSISGLPGDSGGSSGGDCAGKAKWTKAEPYNHAKQPVTFTPFYGQPVPIPFGFSLWSVFDSDAPASRRLESRPWNGNPHDVNSKCAVEHLNAVSQGDFQVSLECESKRQLALESEFNETFATREERNGYRDREKCKSPLKIKDNPGWKDRPLSWWRQNTGQPTGWCMNGSRVEFPVRQPGWRSIKDCDILRSTGTVGPIVTNKRGVRGCKDKD